MNNFFLLFLVQFASAISTIRYPVEIKKQHFQNVLITPRFYKVRMDMIETDKISVNQDLDKKTLMMPLIYDYHTKHNLQCIPFIASPTIETREEWDLHDGVCVGSIITRYIEIKVVLFWRPRFIQIYKLFQFKNS